MLMTNRRLRKGLFGCICGLVFIGSAFLHAHLIKSVIRGDRILISPNTAIQSSPPTTVALNLLPEPVRRLNQRVVYTNRPDFWSWQAPWFQHLPSTTSFPTTGYHAVDSTLPSPVFKRDALRKKLGGNQFLIHLGVARDRWWVGAEPGRLHFIPFDPGPPIIFDFEDVGPDLMAVTTAYFNGTEERILIGSPRSNKIWVFESKGQKITQIQEIRFDAPEETGVRFIQMANIEGRIQADLLVATATWLLTSPVQNGVIIKDPTPVASFYGIESLLVHDFSGDGQDEIVIADWDSVMSLFEIQRGVLSEIDHWEFPVKLLTEGRRCPTYTKIADIDGDARKELIVYEGYEKGRLTQKVHIFSWDAGEKQLVRDAVASPHFSGRDVQKDSEMHLAEIFPVALHPNEKEVLLLLRWFKESGSEVRRFDFVRYRKGRGWVYDSSLDIPEGESPFHGAIQIGAQQIVLGKNQAMVIPSKSA